MIGLIDGIINAVIDHAIAFTMSAERERAYLDRRTPGRTVYAPRIVRPVERWPGQGGGRSWDGPWPHQDWPGGRR